MPDHENDALARPRPEAVRTLWQGGALGPYQLLALRSFADRGHQPEIYSYDPGLSLPKWIVRRNAADILPPERVLRYVRGDRRFAIRSDVFRWALLSQLGGWWIEPDIVLLAATLPEDDFFISCPTQSGMGSVAALKFPAEHSLPFAALDLAMAHGDAEPPDEAMPLTPELIERHGLTSVCRPGEDTSPVSWFDLPLLFDPAKGSELLQAFERNLFLDLHYEAWLRAGVPGYLGPPEGSILDLLLRRHNIDFRFPARLEFGDLVRWMRHMYDALAAEHKIR